MYVYTHICIIAYTYKCISVYMCLLCLYLLYLLIANRQTHHPICQRCQKTKHRHATTIKYTPNIVMSHMRPTPSFLLRILHIPQTPLVVTVVLEVKWKKLAMSKHQFASLNTSDPFSHDVQRHKHSIGLRCRFGRLASSSWYSARATAEMNFHFESADLIHASITAISDFCVTRTAGVIWITRFVSVAAWYVMRRPFSPLDRKNSGLTMAPPHNWAAAKVWNPGVATASVTKSRQWCLSKFPWIKSNERTQD